MRDFFSAFWPSNATGSDYGGTAAPPLFFSSVLVFILQWLSTGEVQDLGFGCRAGSGSFAGSVAPHSVLAVVRFTLPNFSRIDSSSLVDLCVSRRTGRDVWQQQHEKPFDFVQIPVRELRSEYHRIPSNATGRQCGESSHCDFQII